MQSLKQHWHLQSVKLLVGVLLFSSVNAVAQDVLQGWESYLERPDILNVQAAPMASNSNWNQLKEAHFTFVAQLLATYPSDTHIYFLARDSEHLYDVARLVTQGSSDQARMHLLNVSRANMRDTNLALYLNENGISIDSVRAGKASRFLLTVSGAITEGQKC